MPESRKTGNQINVGNVNSGRDTNIAGRDLNVAGRDQKIAELARVAEGSTLEAEIRRVLADIETDRVSPDEAKGRLQKLLDHLTSGGNAAKSLIAAFQALILVL